MHRAIGLTILTATLLGAISAGATERRFVYTYESGVLNPGDVELEPWTTVRGGRSNFYLRFDQRLELEVGLVEGLQTAWYLNLSAKNFDVFGAMGARTRQHEFEFQGVSWEWKLKLADPNADAVGFALYAEVSFGPTEAELEGKVIFDRRFGGLLVALNLVGEYEWKYEDVATETEAVIEADLAAAYFVTTRFSVGLELRSHTVLPAAGPAQSALYLGPVLSFSERTWWATLTVMPQLLGLAGADAGGFEMDEHENLSARLLFGLHI